MIIGRFSPVTRALMPFLVGANHTPPLRFWIFNLIGAVSWVFSSVLIGYVFGAGYHVATGYFGKLVVVAIIAAVLIIWGYRFVNVRFHIFKRYELFMLVLNLVALYVLARTIQDALSLHSFMANFDVYVNLFMERFGSSHQAIVQAFYWITTIGGTKVLASAALIGAIWFAFCKRWRRAAILALSMGSTGLALGAMKAFFLRVRPDNALIATLNNDYSFPSGHAAIAAAFFVILAYLLSRKIHSLLWREIVIVFCVLATLSIGLSRVVLNVHWASDVIAGWALGIFLSTASILAVRYLGASVVKRSENG